MINDQIKPSFGVVHSSPPKTKIERDIYIIYIFMKIKKGREREREREREEKKRK